MLGVSHTQAPGTQPHHSPSLPHILHASPTIQCHFPVPSQQGERKAGGVEMPPAQPQLRVPPPPPQPSRSGERTLRKQFVPGLVGKVLWTIEEKNSKNLEKCSVFLSLKRYRLINQLCTELRTKRYSLLRNCDCFHSRMCAESQCECFSLSKLNLSKDRH